MALLLPSALAPAFSAPIAHPAPAAAARAAVSTMSLETELGATGPLGYWDPLELSKKNPGKFKRWRAVELKHGRIAMMATTGYFVQSILRWPGYLSVSEEVKFRDLPNGILALKGTPTAGLAQIFLFIGLMEVFTWPYLEKGKVPEDKLPGDVAGDLWVRYSDPEVKANKLNVELNNGRAAMMGSLGCLMHDHLNPGAWTGF